ncbi:MAG: hypothetical protein U9R32_08930 [Bacteroidota bacterium]|nr:hypothetical protein [Bacteroidota bacterium]
MTIKRIIIFLVPIILSSCGTGFRPKSDDAILARVQDEYLLESEVTTSIPNNIAPSDSIDIAKIIIKKWVDKKILLEKAKNNLSENDLDFYKQLDDYRNSLITYKYESKLLHQTLDTVVSDDEIKNYFEKNRNNFLLDEDILKINYLILSLDYKNASEARKLFFYNNNLFEIEEYCKKNNLIYYLEDKWLQFPEIKNHLPLKINSISDIKYNDHEFKDANFQYFVRIIDTKQKQELKPISFVKTTIIEIIINKRKQLLLKKMHEEIFNEGIKKNKIEIY